MTALSKWNDRLDSNTAAFVQLSGRLTEGRLNTKPNAKSWSIAQIMEHLISINESYYATFEQLIEGTYKTAWIGRFSVMTNMFGNMILKSVHPDNRRKTKTLKIWEPQQSDISGAIVDEFKASQERLKEYLVRLESLFEANPTISSPANRNVVYSLQTAIEIIVAHQERHLRQASEVSQHLG